MKKIAFAALLIAVSMKAQNNSSVQTPAPAGPEVTSQAPAQPQPAAPAQQNEKAYEEARKKLQELGYFDTTQPKTATIPPTKPCAIPLQSIPIPALEQFAIKNAAPKPVDPKIVQAPPLATCAKSEPSRAIIPERKLEPEKK